MAAGILPKPGTKAGPCTRYEGLHEECKQTRRDARTLCRFCEKAIGYGVGFYRARLSGELAHAACREAAVERNDARVGLF